MLICLFLPLSAPPCLSLPLLAPLPSLPLQSSTPHHTTRHPRGNLKSVRTTYPSIRLHHVYLAGWVGGRLELLNVVRSIDVTPSPSLPAPLPSSLPLSSLQMTSLCALTCLPPSSILDVTLCMAFPQLGPRYVSLPAYRVLSCNNAEKPTPRLSPCCARALGVMAKVCGR
jgi:hypothetical protein